jgi:uncharacterized protein (TIGR00725 family)
MSATFRLDRAGGALFDGAGRRFDAAARVWREADGSAGGSSGASRIAATGESVDAVAAATWLQRGSGHPLRVPVGVIGPRVATPAQTAAAFEVGEGLARCGFTVVCGGRHGVMQAVCEGVARGGGLSIGLLPDADASHANPFVGVVIATGIGEARNALIARAAFCLVAIGDSFGTLSEVALGRQFDKPVIGLEGAARVDGVEHLTRARDAIARVAALALSAGD